MTPRPAPKTLHPGSVLTVAAVLVAGGTLTLAALSSFGVFRHGTSAAALVLEGPSAVELGATLARVGITAENLAAAGCSAEDVTGLVQDAVASLDAAAWTALQNADSGYRDAAADADRLGKLVRAGQASQDDLSGYATAKATLASAQTTRDGLLEGFFGDATDGLTQGQVTLLQTIHAAADRHVPVQYKAKARTDAEWTSLRNALANLKTAAQCGEDDDYNCSQLVTQTDAETEVVTAETNLDQHLASVEAAFGQALGI